MKTCLRCRKPLNWDDRGQLVHPSGSVYCFMNEEAAFISRAVPAPSEPMVCRSQSYRGSVCSPRCGVCGELLPHPTSECALRLRRSLDEASQREGRVFESLELKLAQAERRVADLERRVGAEARLLSGALLLLTEAGASPSSTQLIDASERASRVPDELNDPKDL